MGGNSHISLGNSFNEKRGARKDNQQLLVCSLSIGQRNLNYTSISITTIESHSSIGGMDNNRPDRPRSEQNPCAFHSGRDPSDATSYNSYIVLQKLVGKFEVCFPAVHPRALIVKETICSLLKLLCDCLWLFMPLEPGLILLVEAPTLIL